jgi:hypothetical protein
MAAAYLEKFASDSLEELLTSLSSYVERLKERRLWRVS